MLIIIIIIRNGFVGFMDWCGLCESAAMVNVGLVADVRFRAGDVERNC